MVMIEENKEGYRKNGREKQIEPQRQSRAIIVGGYKKQISVIPFTCQPLQSALAQYSSTLAHP
jgi:hypothetical protein